MRRNESGRERPRSQAEGNVWVNTRERKELGVFKICEGETNMMGRQCNPRISIYDSSRTAGATAADTD